MCDEGAVIAEEFAVKLTDTAKTHDEWLSIVKFGLPTLLNDEQLLMEIIVRRAMVLNEENRVHTGARVIADDARGIMDDLSLKFVLAG